MLIYIHELIFMYEKIIGPTQMIQSALKELKTVFLQSNKHIIDYQHTGLNKNTPGY